MSLVRNVLRSISEITGVAYQSAAHISRNTSAFSRAHEQIQEKITPFTRRYTILDKRGELKIDVTNGVKKKVMNENKYFVTKVNKEKTRCFAQIENMKNQIKNYRKQYVLKPQTVYDSEQPDLWKRVKAMYKPIYISTLPYKIDG